MAPTSVTVPDKPTGISPDPQPPPPPPQALRERRGRIVFSTAYRPPVPFDIFACPFSPSCTNEELHLTDGVSYNYNGCSIPPAALKTLLKNPKLAEEDGTTDADVDAGHVSGLIFVSERNDGLEILHIALHFNVDSRVKVFALADIFGAANFIGPRLEDSGCIGGGYNVGSRMVGHSLIYTSTKEPVQQCRSPWTVVYKTNLSTGKTERLTPQGVFDLSPAVSPSGKMVAVASFQSKSWNGEIENLKTDIYVMNVDGEDGLGRKLLIKNGGWPSWGSDNIIFFHRGTEKTLPFNMVETAWGVFRYKISTEETMEVTPKELDAVTPAAISETKVAVATIRQKSRFDNVRVEVQYRHIEIFDTNNAPGMQPVQITQKTRPKTDHYNPFVRDNGGRIGYHRCRSDLLQHGDHIPSNLHKIVSPVKDVGLYRVSGLSPTISKDGSKLAFVDGEFKAVWVADHRGLRIVYDYRGPHRVFSPVWNQNPDKDILYVCIGTSFNADKTLEIYAINNASGDVVQRQRLTYGGYNNAFPSSSPDGSKFVFRSTRDGGVKKYKNLHIMLEAENGQSGIGWETRLTKGPWTDTHCQWSPTGDWVVFSSTRGKPRDADELDNGLDPGYFSVYLVKPSDPMVVIRVMDSMGDLGGHINHPVFSPDGRSIAVTADLAAVSVDPISLPMFMHAVRPYGDIFMIDLDTDNLKNINNFIKGFRRITHSRNCVSANLIVDSKNRRFGKDQVRNQNHYHWPSIDITTDMLQPIALEELDTSLVSNPIHVVACRKLRASSFDNKVNSLTRYTIRPNTFSKVSIEWLGAERCDGGLRCFRMLVMRFQDVFVEQNIMLACLPFCLKCNYQYLPWSLWMLPNKFFASVVLSNLN
uniref:Protein tolB n=1 Tax=Aegilops tauschii TaxID=37682 RepID=M8C5H9_AEGTA